MNFGKYDFNVCTFLNWKVLRKEMSSHLNITCSAKFVCVHLGGGVWVPLLSISCPCVSAAVSVCYLSYPGTSCSGSQCRCLLSLAV